MTDHEIFSRYRRRRRRLKRTGGLSLAELSALKVGDYVVHEDHGIGVYRGMKRLTLNGQETDCIEISYAESDRLFVPVQQLALVSRYAASEGAKPSLHRLGSGAWQKTKARAKKAIQEMAEGLVRAYAARKALAGHALQARHGVAARARSVVPLRGDARTSSRAIADVKEDLESRPADGPPDLRRRRLRQDRGRDPRRVQGGAGRRGRSRCSCRPRSSRSSTCSPSASGSPTTRCASRCCRGSARRASRRRLLKATAAGQGRHPDRHPSAPVQGRQDSEPRAGRDRRGASLRRGARRRSCGRSTRLVDVLAMTATPIPRTLNLSLAGARDMSVIETPPRDRLPVHTEILEHDDEVVSDAILREIDRGGQVFFVHNRVETIHNTALHVQKLVPQVQVAVGARPDGRAPARARDARVPREEERRAGVDHDHRVGARHPERQHADPRSRRHARAGPALPAARSRRPLVAPRLRLPARAVAARAHRGSREAAAGDRGARRPRRRVQDRAQGSRDPRRRQHARPRAEWLHRRARVRPLRQAARGGGARG